MASTEIYYCGNCQNEQNIRQGEKCRRCGETTVSYNWKTETKVDAQRRWDKLFGPIDYGTLKEKKKW